MLPELLVTFAAVWGTFFGLKWAFRNGCGQRLPTQTVTLGGRSTDISQRKDVDRHSKPQSWSVGYIAYDLNIDGVISDLTATFVIFEKGDSLAIVLEEIHVL